MLILPLAFALQQGIALPGPEPRRAPPPAKPVNSTTPPSGDTAGYWQQRADYRIVVRLDEARHAARATGTLTYVNRSPDTLREMYVHQYLNAFRPGSRWSAADAREGRVRFQHLPDSAIGYERFTAVPAFDGVAVAPVYPYAPDSTVARFALPRPLAPGDSVIVAFAWEARPSATVYRRQGRRGRHYDFAQWFPKVAVYDRNGWEPNPLVPAGELYGEFGTFDVTIVAKDDQVLGATGVPVDGDPGWARALAAGAVTIPRGAYDGVPPAPAVTVDSGERAVRFYARSIHHFAWTASPDYRYEGGMYRDSIALGVLYEPRGEKGWGHGAMLERQRRTLAWLESIYGPYAYPLVLGTQRLDGGATEFPMMVMYGGPGPSWGLVLHEVGHIYTYGILANNEWRSGWMDEGLTEYQSDWAQNLTLPERAAGLGPKDPPPPAGYRGKAHRPPRWQQDYIDLFRLDLEGRAEPIGTAGQDFNEFTIYNESVYSRASMMYGALRNVLGDSLFRAFLRDYYARWKLKHVDELAMRASAERVSGRELGWLFDEWVHHTGLVDYEVRGDSAVRVAGYVQDPMTTARLASGREQVDPLHVTPDWDSRNDGEANPTTWVFGWPFLDQWDRYRNVAEIQPMAWYTNPGGMTFGARVTTNYQGMVDRWDVGLAMAVRSPVANAWTQLQGWAVVDDPKIPWTGRPVLGLREGLWMVDGTFRYEMRMKWDESPFKYANGEHDTITVALNVTSPYDRAWQDTLRWSNATVADVSASWSWRAAHPSNWFVRGTVDAGIAFGRANAPWNGVFGTATLAAGTTAPLTADGKLQLAVRGFGALSSAAPPQNSVGLSAQSPLETFTDDYLRGAGAVLVLPDVPYVQLGGAGLRGYTLYARVVNGASLNTQLAYTFVQRKPGTLVPRVDGALFGDGAYASLAGADSSNGTWIGDAGVSAILRGALYDRAYVLRLDFPVWLSDPELAPGRAASGERVKFRWTFTVGDLW